MGLLGALVGGSLGLILGGPIGAMIGGAIGLQIGDPSPAELRGIGGGRRLYGRCGACGASVSFAPDEPLVCGVCGARLDTAGTGPGRAGFDGQARNAAQGAFMVALISLAAKVAKADGRVTREEVVAFDRFLGRELGMSADDRRIAARIFNQARDSAVPASAFARQLAAIMAGQPDRLRDLLTLLLKVAAADGRLDAAEERLIRQIAADLGLGPRDYEEARALVERRDDLGSAYALLGLAPTASDDEVKRSYRRLVRDYHPDVIASKGLPEDFTRFANEKLQAINRAYERIRRARGL